MSSPRPTVRHRHVFFIAGFDPKSPRWYHALYRNQARRQAAIGGPVLEVGRERSRPCPVSTGWTIRGSGPAGAVTTAYELLQWDDIVRRHWAGSATRVLIDGLRTVAFGLRDGAVQRMHRLFRPPVYATLLPLAVLAACAALSVTVGLGVALALRPVGSLALQLAAAAAAGAAAFGLGLHAAHRIRITWLLRLVHFALLQATGRADGIEQRLDDFAERIAGVAAAAGADRPDEILVIGHSVGATLALSVLARAHQRLPAAADQPPIAFLSLGHCIPLHTSLSAARRLRDELQWVAASDIDWLDVTAPIDWAAFPAVDPVAAAGLPPAPAGWHPRLVSPRLHTLFGARTYARLRRNRFRVHMQYLMASERSGAYDYFAITAGAQRLRERFAAEPDASAADAPAE